MCFPHLLQFRAVSMGHCPVLSLSSPGWSVLCCADSRLQAVFCRVPIFKSQLQGQNGEEWKPCRGELGRPEQMAGDPCCPHSTDLNSTHGLGSLQGRLGDAVCLQRQEEAKSRSTEKLSAISIFSWAVPQERTT